MEKSCFCHKLKVSPAFFFLSTGTANLFFIPNNLKTTANASVTKKLDDCNSPLKGDPCGAPPLLAYPQQPICSLIGAA